MRAFTCHTGIVVPLARVNIDTDQIIPKQFLKRIERTGFGEFLFYDWRYGPDGAPNPDFELNTARFQGASIVLGGRNFGCGSSREHAVWALDDFGIRAIIAPSFADIFYANCLSNGLLPVVLSAEEVTDLIDRTRRREGYELTIDLERSLVEDDGGFSTSFPVAPFHRTRLLHGLDDIGLTLQREEDIEDYERRLECAPLQY